MLVHEDGARLGRVVVVGEDTGERVAVKLVERAESRDPLLGGQVGGRAVPERALDRENAGARAGGVRGIGAGPFSGARRRGREGERERERREDGEGVSHAWSLSRPWEFETRAGERRWG